MKTTVASTQQRLSMFKLLIPSLSLLAAFNSLADPSYRALYVYGHEVNTVQLCDHPDQVLWVVGEEPVLQELQKYYAQNSLEPYQALPITVIGGIEPKAEDGFASEYDGQFQVLKWTDEGAENCAP